jgi:hypothetical protein
LGFGVGLDGSFLGFVPFAVIDDDSGELFAISRIVPYFDLNPEFSPKRHKILLRSAFRPALGTSQRFGIEKSGKFGVDS